MGGGFWLFAVGLSARNDGTTLSQRAPRGDKVQRIAGRGLRSLRDRDSVGAGVPGVALRLPPATVCDPVGIVAGRGFGTTRALRLPPATVCDPVGIVAGRGFGTTRALRLPPATVCDPVGIVAGRGFGTTRALREAPDCGRRLSRSF